MFDVIFSLFLTFVSLFGLSFATDTKLIDSSTINSQVLSVVDGDTIEVLYNGKREKVRYIGIDTPEPYRDGDPACYSHEATEKNKDLVAGKEVTLVSDIENKDRYGRLLRYVYVGETFVNAELVAEGFAKTLRIKPNTTHATDLKMLQEQAKSDGKGLWGECVK